MDHTSFVLKLGETSLIVAVIIISIQGGIFSELRGWASFISSQRRSEMRDDFMVELKSGQVNVSENTRAENLTPGEARCGIFSELGDCALLYLFPRQK
jgi:hypothetical protein